MGHGSLDSGFMHQNCDVRSGLSFTLIPSIDFEGEKYVYLCILVYIYLYSNEVSVLRLRMHTIFFTASHIPPLQPPIIPCMSRVRLSLDLLCLNCKCTNSMLKTRPQHLAKAIHCKVNQAVRPRRTCQLTKRQGCNTRLYCPIYI